MARKRMISPSIWESAYDNGWDAADLAVMIAAISSADDEGRGRVSMIFRNLGQMIQMQQFNKSLKKLEASIVIYDEIYYYLPNWEEYQTISRPVASKFPKPKSFNKKDLTEKNANKIVHDSIPSEVSISENSLKEINVSEVKENTHISFNELFTVYYLTFNESPTPQEKNQITSTVKDYLEFVQFEEQEKIFKNLCRRIREGPNKIKNKGYFFGTFKLQLQDTCARRSITQAKAISNAMKF